MAIIKCKMCGGDLNITAGQTVAQCEYCDSTQTIPSADNEKKLALFQRANKLRFTNEFDKAAGLYEAIVADFRDEAEAYWGLVLCKYGIEYVDDPATGKKVPTCHRSSFDSVMEDDNFEQALENADVAARKVYRDEAKVIEELRKNIIEVSAKEEPYDIFICYKESDPNGDRTLDSAIAQDVYDALTAKGYRVFFSRITLEDKLGQEYEPYIFAALNSARIMLAFGTDYEYFNAVWVKNEWSRYLQLMAKDKERHLIPCYKGIDPYDMPREFAKLQAQDMGKVGAIQDLLRGIEKLLPKAAPTVAQVVPAQRDVAKKTSLENADTYIALKNYDQAMKIYTTASKSDASDYRAWWGMIVATTKGFTKCGDQISKDVKTWLGYVKTLAPKDQLAKYMAVFEPYITDVVRQADRTVAEGKLEEAEGLYTNVLTMKGKDYRASWGKILTSTKNLNNYNIENCKKVKTAFDEIRKEVTEAQAAPMVKKYQEYVTEGVKLGNSFMQEKEYSKATIAYQSANALDPQYAEALWGMIRAKTEDFSQDLHDDKQIIDWYTKLKKLTPPEQFVTWEQTVFNYLNHFAQKETYETIQRVQKHKDEYKAKSAALKKPTKVKRKKHLDLGMIFSFDSFFMALFVGGWLLLTGYCSYVTLGRKLDEDLVNPLRYIEWNFLADILDFFADLFGWLGVIVALGCFVPTVIYLIYYFFKCQFGVSKHNRQARKTDKRVKKENMESSARFAARSEDCAKFLTLKPATVHQYVVDQWATPYGFKIGSDPQVGALLENADRDV